MARILIEGVMSAGKTQTLHEISTLARGWSGYAGAIIDLVERR